MVSIDYLVENFLIKIDRVDMKQIVLMSDTFFGAWILNCQLLSYWPFNYFASHDISEWNSIVEGFKIESSCEVTSFLHDEWWYFLHFIEWQSIHDWSTEINFGNSFEENLAGTNAVRFIFDYILCSYTVNVVHLFKMKSK